MTEQPPPPPPPPTPGPMGGPPPTPGVPRPGELLDRFLARLIDGVLFGVVFVVLSIIFTGIFVSGITTSVGEALLVSLFLTIITTALYIGYFAFLESSQGATIGKMVMKLKVYGPDGVSNPTMEQAVRRNLWYAASLIGIIPFVGFFLGPIASLAAVIFIAVGINNDTVARQGWHDKFAGGTRVMKVG
jgi:uncharacterized RDD family membrane protein YckC